MDKLLSVFKKKLLESFRYRSVVKLLLSMIVTQEGTSYPPAIPCSYYSEIMGSLGNTDDDPMAASCKVMLAGTLSKKLLSEVTEGVNKLQRAPLLVGFLSSTDPPARVYAEWTAKTAREK